MNNEITVVTQLNSYMYWINITIKNKNTTKSSNNISIYHIQRI